MKIGLFFGSFNPVHIGHMIIANYMATRTELNQVWFVISPHNPFKKKSSLARDYDRLHLVNLAIGYNNKLKTSTIEFNLPQPSYTVDTLAHLGEKFPEHEVCLIMGSDNLHNFHKWKNYEHILIHHDIKVYKREGFDGGNLAGHERVEILETPLMNISATYIRNSIRDGKSIQYLVPESVYEYLSTSSLYRS
jgi:nicotinate-nucleotide adenylyltransferase